MSGVLWITIIQRAILQGTPLLYGSTGEILTEKSGNLNLGIPGIMYMGAISGVIGAFFYQSSAAVVEPTIAILVSMLSCILGSLLLSLIYCFLTITLRANQNVTGLAITTFGVGCGNLFGGSLIKIVKSDVPYLSLVETAKAFKTPLIEFETDNEILNNIQKLFFSYGFMVYLALIIAIITAIVIKRTKIGLNLRAIGENPATADAAGINVPRYKYVATCVGGVIAGFGGLFYILDYSNGIWANSAFGDRGWLAIAIVIFATWKPMIAILGSYLFGALYVLYNYMNVPMRVLPIMQMLPYLVTLLVLIAVSIRKKRENQPPASLGLSYFREDR